MLCSRCHKNIAVVFVTRVEKDKTVNEGLCLQCAKELGIKPVNDLLTKMGIDENDLEAMNEGMSEMLGGKMPTADGLESPDSKAPAIDLGAIFGRELPPKHDARKTNKDGKEKTGENKAPERKYLSAFCTNLNAKAHSGKLDAVVGRDHELDRMIQILCRRQKNNPCLIGEPGVGKTAIADALAIKIDKGDVPFALKDKELYSLDMASVVAGTQFRGQFESRLKGLVAEVKAIGNIILVIDEVHSIVAAGDADGSMNAANILKPSLASGDIQVIGATTLSEYRKFIEKDTALERRFQPIVIEEPSLSDTVEILRGIKHYYEEYHSVIIPENLLSEIVMLSERYITDRFLPDKAIDLLDEAASRLALDSDILEKYKVASADLKTARENLAKLESELEASLAENKVPEDEFYANTAKAKTEVLKLEETVKELSEEKKKVVLTRQDLAQVIEIWTKVPAGNISENEFERVDKLRERLSARIVGQDEAIDAICRAIKRNRAGIYIRKRPVSFIFAGPTGVGKTELVKTLANDMFDSPDALIRLDMSEYMEKHSVSKIIGSPPGYVGYDDAGQLTEKIRRKPYAVILFDEIEKAHPDVMNILLQILDDGKVTDSHGKEVNFENTVIVMTTNAGSNMSSMIGFGDTVVKLKEKTEKALLGFLRPEFINRVDEIITFAPLSAETFSKIATIMLTDLSKVMKDKGIELCWNDDAIKLISEKSYSEKYGARNLRRTIQTQIEDKIASVIVANYDRLFARMDICVENGDIVINAQ